MSDAVTKAIKGNLFQIIQFIFLAGLFVGSQYYFRDTTAATKQDEQKRLEQFDRELRTEQRINIEQAVILSQATASITNLQNDTKGLQQQLAKLESKVDVMASKIDQIYEVIKGRK